MKIAIVGTGNVGGALATAFSNAGHQIYLGVRDTENFKGRQLLKNPNTAVFPIAEAVAKSETVVLSTPAQKTVEVCTSMGDTSGKVIIDTMNIVKGNGPKGYTNTTEAILTHTQTDELVKCFNTTGFNNMENPIYKDFAIDAFMAGDSKKAKRIARQLAKEIGFGECYDVGGNDKFDLMEQYAWFWINLAMFQGQGREIGFKLLNR